MNRGQPTPAFDHPSKEEMCKQQEATDMTRANQTSEQAARENIDRLLTQAGWVVQDKKGVDFKASLGLAIREYQTDVGPADYVLCIDRKSVGVVTVRRNFQQWIVTRHSGSGEKFNEGQMDWLRMIRDHIITSFHLDRDDLDMAPFDGKGGLGQMYKLFGDRMDDVIDELNEALAA